jgi:uncharacterized protein (DUF302 family)
MEPRTHDLPTLFNVASCKRKLQPSTRTAMTGDQQGLTKIASHYSVDETVDRIDRALTARGITIFCRVDHSGAAAAVGLAMRPTKLLIFGSPLAGTPPMLAAPSLAIDLPLKALVWQDADEQVWVVLNEPAYLARRHGLPDDLVASLAGPAAVIAVALSA